MVEKTIYGKTNYHLEYQRIEKSNLSVRNKELIIKFLDDLLAVSIGQARAIKLGGELRKIAEMFGKEFEEVTIEDIKVVVKKINLSENMTESTKSDYKRCIKQFYKWLKGNGESFPTEVKWIKTRIKLRDTRLIDEIITQDEILKAIEQCKNKRDKALLMFTYEAGGRIAEILTMRIKDFYMDKFCARARLIGKTGERIIPIVNSIPFISAYLDDHPLRNDPSAYLWLSIGTYHHNKQLMYQGAKKIIKRAFKDAGIKKHSNPHLFRHSRASELAKVFTEAQMCKYFGWVIGSGQTRTYVHISGKDLDNSILLYNGVEIDSKTKESNLLKNKTCPRCQKINSVTSKYCNQCSAALDIKTVIDSEEKFQNETDKVMQFLMQMAKDPQLMKEFEEFKSKRGFEVTQ